MIWDSLAVLLILLSPFTVLGMWDRRALIKRKINDWTKPKAKEAPK